VFTQPIAYPACFIIIGRMKPDTQHFKELLTNERAVLEKELPTVGKKSQTNPKDWEATEPEDDIDRADETEVADSIEAYESNTGVLEQLEARLAEVNAALEKIEQGTYGTCVVCGKEIEPDRLEANPASATCKEHMN